MPDIEKYEGEALTFGGEGFDSDEYADVACRARLVQVHLTDCEYSAKVPEIISNQNEDDSLSPSFEGEPGGCNYIENLGYFIGDYFWRVDIKHGRRKLLKLRCKYVLIYENVQDCDEKYVQLYFSKIGRFTTYPYFRAEFAAMVSNSGLTFPPLPSLTDRID